MLLKLFKRKPKPAARVVRIACVEWTKEDTGVAKSFFSSQTFERLKAFADGQLVRIMLAGNAPDDNYRKGWLDCQRQYAAFASVEDDVKDSLEKTSMQMIEDE